jgi:hypothetical protein
MNIDTNIGTVYFTVKKKNVKAILLGISLIVTLIAVNADETALARHSHNSQSTNSPQPVDPLLCWGAGGLMVLSGVPITQVIGAGQAAHAAGICP